MGVTIIGLVTIPPAPLPLRKNYDRDSDWGASARLDDLNGSFYSL